MWAWFVLVNVNLHAILNFLLKKQCSLSRLDHVRVQSLYLLSTEEYMLLLVPKGVHKTGVCGYM